MRCSNLVLVLFSLFMACLICLSSSKDADASEKTEKNDEPATEEQITYAKGSLCGYCDYCKFCKLCDADCPCETSPSKPNCKMCKYCKYCYLCKGLCDTICQPGGIVDTISASLVNALPTHNKDEINNDIDSVKDWIDRKKDEL